MERRILSLRGVVQGVGFRPFVHGLASRLGLGGFVKNQSGEVVIEVEGARPALDDFVTTLARDPPPLAFIERLVWHSQPPKGEQNFRIDTSDTGSTGSVFISPDVATCADCLRELFDPGDRRYRYPFINCTNCGPRLTIITGGPYDRERTTMASFAMCGLCRAEYDNPTDRRFHAQPIACPVCGPRLRLCDNAGHEMPGTDAVRGLAVALLEGRVGAIKGLGGYHLACAASNARAVTTLRRRKHREEKPFAVMVRDVAAAARFCAISAEEARLLESLQRPIVLLRKRADLTSAQIAEGVAPGNPFLGVMLPYTPLHHLLVSGIGDQPLVMTSGNRSDEPIAYEDADAFTRLADIADVFLIHNRPIHVRCDDSVLCICAGQEMPLRRSRGYAPQPIALPFACPQPILAVGGQLKATFALGRDSSAFLSHHLGDLDHYEALRAFERDIGLYEALFACKPEKVAHDLHPDYASSRYAQNRGLKTVAVQHHHAHLASCMAENRLEGSVLGVILDGAGYGSDGTIWGGEFLVGDYRRFRRGAHLRYVGMPGGEQATRNPWRMALAYLRDAGMPLKLVENRIPKAALKTCLTLLERRFNSPETSSFGRLFDAVACLVGLRESVSHEAQAAMELEWQALEGAAEGVYPFDLVISEGMFILDPRLMIREIVNEVEQTVSTAVIGRRFHITCATMITDVCNRLHKTTGINRVVLSGGVFLNALLTSETTSRLEAEGFSVYRHRLVPPGDGGLSLGQLAIAAHS